jgi:IS5 family transposase
MDKVALMEFTIEVVCKLEGQQGFAVQPRRWVVEGTFAWLLRWRRLVRDYEQRIDVSRLGRMREKLEVLKASVRAKVEHPFLVIKNLFRHRKTRYRGLAKNTAQLFTLFGLANLMLAGRRFAMPATQCTR